MSGETTSEETTSDDDISLNDLSANHNNDLFHGAVAETCVDALAHMELAAESLTTPAELDPTTPRPKEDEEYLLASADNSGYHAPVGEDSANLWNKAMTTLAKGKCNNKDADEKDNSQGSTNSPAKDRLSAYDMSHILDGSIHGGEAPSKSDNVGKKQRQSNIVPSSEFSIDGESAILWGDEPEKAYFAYMLEQEAEHRALEGKDQDDSLMAESTRQELMQGLNGGTSSFEEDDTTLGNPSKVFGAGWDPSTVAGREKISTLTPSFNNSSQQRDKNGQLIIPNVIYVQDGTDADPKVQARTWGDSTDKKTKESGKSQKPEQAAENASHRLLGNKSKAAAKQLEEGNDENGAGGDAQQQQRPKSGWYTNRFLICAALFFLVLTTGLVAILIVYRNNYTEETSPTSTASTNLDENGNPIDPPSAAPMTEPTEAPSPAPYTVLPTVDLFKKKDSNLDGEDEDDDETALAGVPVWAPTDWPTWLPTATPTWSPTKTPSFIPTWAPTDSPTWAPTEAPSPRPTGRPTNEPSETPTQAPTTEEPTRTTTQSPSSDPTESPSHHPTRVASVAPIFTPSKEPTQLPSVPLTRSPTTSPISAPSASPTKEPTMLPTKLTVDTPPGHNASAPEKDVTPAPVLGPSSNTTIVIFIPDTDDESKPPTRRPTRAPSEVPIPAEFFDTIAPSSNPTPTALGAAATPTTARPSPAPTLRPTPRPPTTETLTPRPTPSPTLRPTPRPPTTASPTPEPTARPTSRPPTTQPPTLAPTRSPTQPPTPLPTFLTPTTRVPTTDAPVPAYVALDTVRNFLLEYAPMSREELFNTDSTRYAALVWLSNWMASIPPQELGRITKRRLVQRWWMAVLYLELNGPNWLNGSEDWMGDEDACQWLRVNNQGSCNRDLLVETLDLSNNNLRGTLPKEISLLGGSITRLEMDRNDISGPLPVHFGRMRRLVSLDFTRTDLTGTLPTELGNLQSLAILGLGRNDFTGTIPSEIGRLNNLVYLGLERNDVRGTIPRELASLVYLEYLALDWNALTGTVPFGLRNLVNLRTLILARNSLVGAVPSVFCDRSMDFLAADCDEVSCQCCDLCCKNGAGCSST